MVVPDVEAYPGHIGQSFAPSLCSCPVIPTSAFRYHQPLLPPLPLDCVPTPYAPYSVLRSNHLLLVFALTLAACDGDTKSEIVLPLIIDTAKGKRVIGVLDLDSTGLSIFDEDDRIGLQRIVDMLQTSCEWA